MSNSLHITEAWHCVQGHEFARATKSLREISTNIIYLASRLPHNWTSFLQCHQYTFPSLISQSEPIHCAPTVTHTSSRAVHSGLRWQPMLVWQAVLDFCSAGFIICFLLRERLLSLLLQVCCRQDPSFPLSQSWSALSCWNEVTTVCPKRSIFSLKTGKNQWTLWIASSLEYAPTLKNDKNHAAYF